MNISKTSGNDLATFQTISDFVSNVYEYYGSPSTKALNMYYRLVNKLSFKDDDLILRHLQVFKQFCLLNRECIKQQSTQLREPKITFSDNIYIDMNYIFRKANESGDIKTIWEYILAISAYLDPSNNTKELLKSMQQGGGGGGPDGDFINTMMSTLAAGAGAGAGAGTGEPNPLGMMANLMNSDMMTQMMSAMTSKVDNGSLDISALVNTVSGLVDTVKTEINRSNDPALQTIIKSNPILDELFTIPEEGAEAEVEETARVTERVIEIEEVE